MGVRLFGPLFLTVNMGVRLFRDYFYYFWMQWPWLGDASIWL